MSLDETFDQMRTFAAALERFDEALRASHRQLAERHAAVEGLWQDAFAREYAAAWEPLARDLERWVQHDGTEYRDFVTTRLRALAQYLEDGS
ncbi:MAG: hypothetical protein GC151_13475 [Betaproteobacteria bacterium]|nr:hypothetical protein [Betaproteobacteria bacterium]